MSVQATLPLLLMQQMGPTGKLAHDQATHPEAVQSMNSQMAKAMLLQQTRQVQKLEDSDAMPSIRDQEKQRGDSAQQEQKRRAHEDEEEEGPPPIEDPLVGIVLNCKI